MSERSWDKSSNPKITKDSQRALTGFAKARDLLRDLEAVADSAQGLQILGMARIALDFLAQAADVNIDRARRNKWSFLPHCIEQLIPGEDAASMRRKILKETELTHGGQDIVSADLNRHAGDVDFEIAEAKHLCPGSRVTQSAQHSSNACHEFARTERLGDVVIAAQFQPFHAISFRGFRGEKDDGNGRQSGRLPNLAAQFKAVDSGQHDIQ